ncbi:MAG: prepilin-type N-terminal cleavage/methylation domain-containing protein [Planctomycetota bacterium]|jgi:prepilin-type N-terminal cleavage/methylation domain-containing protein
MKNCKKHNGFTLIELLAVIAITVILIGIVAGVASRIDTQNKERLLRGTFAQLDVALQEFADYGYRYDLTGVTDEEEVDFYNSLDYPPDCNDLPLSNIIDPFNLSLEQVLESTLGMTRNKIELTVVVPAHKPEYSGCLAMYFFLNRVPASRKYLGRINPQFLTDEDESGNKMFFTMGIGQQARYYQLMRILDPWGKTLRYDYYISLEDFRKISLKDTLNDYYKFVTENKKTFPVFISAGPDGKWWTGDDIKSR